MPAQLLGAHMPIKGGVGNGLRSGKAIGCTAVQVFTSSPRQWYCAPVDDEKVRDYRKAVAETGIEHVVSHDSYLVNLCAPDETLAAKSCRALTDEMGHRDPLAVAELEQRLHGLAVAGLADIGEPRR